MRSCRGPFGNICLRLTEKVLVRFNVAVWRASSLTGIPSVCYNLLRTILPPTGQARMAWTLNVDRQRHGASRRFFTALSRTDTGG